MVQFRAIEQVLYFDLIISVNISHVRNVSLFEAKEIGVYVGF